MVLAVLFTAVTVLSWASFNIVNLLMMMNSCKKHLVTLNVREICFTKGSMKFKVNNTGDWPFVIARGACANFAVCLEQMPLVNIHFMTTEMVVVRAGRSVELRGQIKLEKTDFFNIGQLLELTKQRPHVKGCICVPFYFAPCGSVSVPLPAVEFSCHEWVQQLVNHWYTPIVENVNHLSDLVRGASQAKEHIADQLNSAYLSLRSQLSKQSDPAAPGPPQVGSDLQDTLNPVEYSHTESNPFAIGRWLPGATWPASTPDTPSSLPPVQPQHQQGDSGFTDVSGLAPGGGAVTAEVQGIGSSADVSRGHAAAPEQTQARLDSEEAVQPATQAGAQSTLKNRRRRRCQAGAALSRMR